MSEARGKVLCLRTVNHLRQSYGHFQWPESGLVSAPDWDRTPRCGNGLHGLLKGEGDGSLLNTESDAIWQVVEVDPSTCIELSGKVKFPSCNVIYSGSREEATRLIKDRHPEATVAFSAVIVGDHKTAAVGYGGTAAAGNYGAATAGEYGIATAGEYGTAAAGDSGTAAAGDSGTATAGDSGTATAGHNGTATAGYGGTATAGHNGTAKAGDYGTATAGSCGAATAGYKGTATAGDYGTATAGHKGTAAAGENGSIILKWWDDTRYRLFAGNIGEGGLEPNVKYRLDDNRKFVKETK